MRIISGRWKGRHLLPPKNITARPTTDFAKEALFNVLNNELDFEGLTVLDLFAGTGSISLEFISRGAQTVVSVEMAHTQGDFIRKTCQSMQIENLMLMRQDVFKYLPTCHMQFDCIFADPPYDLSRLAELPDLILDNQLLKEDGLLVLEHGKGYDFSEHTRFVQHRQYGSVNFSFFK